MPSWPASELRSRSSRSRAAPDHGSATIDLRDCIEFLANRPWDQLESEKLSRWTTCLQELPLDLAHYYLPAFLDAMERDPAGNDGLDNVTLTGSSFWLYPFFTNLSPERRSIVADVLRHQANCCEPDEPHLQDCLCRAADRWADSAARDSN